LYNQNIVKLKFNGFSTNNNYLWISKNIQKTFVIKIKYKQCRS